MVNLTNEIKIGIIGLGYVGLPLACEFGKLYNSIGFDIKPHRIEELQSGLDITKEVSPQEINDASNLIFTNHIDDLFDVNVFSQNIAVQYIHNVTFVLHSQRY